MDPSPSLASEQVVTPRVGWLTPGRCRLILAALLAGGFLGHLAYLHGPGALGLTGDEAHYWDWSRQLDLSYYSKGPGIAWIIRGSCALFGDNMPAVRLPALVFSVGTCLLTYWLTRRLFGSDRMALGAVVLCHLMPLFIAGSLLITIDSPFYFCWAAATSLAAVAVFSQRRWAWVAMGVVVGLGFLAKYAMGLWLVSLATFLLVDRDARRWRTAGPWVMLAVAVPFTIPVIVWNVRHAGVTLRHVAGSVGRSDGGFSPMGLLDLVGAQIGVLGPPMFVLMAAAVVWGWRRKGEVVPPSGRSADEGVGTTKAGVDAGRAIRFLLCMALPYLAIVALPGLWGKVQANWPAPGYFTLVILTAYFLADRLKSAPTWRPWRHWVRAAAVVGVVLMPILHDGTLLYPAVGALNRLGEKMGGGAGKALAKLRVRAVDPAAKFRGYDELGGFVGGQLKTLRPGAFVLADDYQTASELAFHIAGQPRTYCAGSYFQDPDLRKRHTQFDLWPDRSLDPADTQLLGRDAIYVGHVASELRGAFRRVEPLGRLDIERRGVKIRSVECYRCTDFRGIPRPGGDGSY